MYSNLVGTLDAATPGLDDPIYEFWTPTHYLRYRVRFVESYGRVLPMMDIVERIPTLKPVRLPKHRFHGDE